MRTRNLLLTLAASALASVGAPAGAAQVDTNVVTVDVDGGTISLVSRVYDEAEGDPSRWLFEYELSGDWDPEPTVTNGISSLKLFFGGLLDDVAGEAGPTEWVLDLEVAIPPFGVGFDLPGPAFGVGSSASALFSFTVPAGTAWTALDSGSFVASHEGETLVDPVALVDDEGGFGPLVPAPEPSGLALALGAIATLGALRRR
ncbi:MAG: hypothetical protein OZ948_12230 [Deltaproteobacteria bacterium]|nr:hypothetical protein [Deltaproteobacteria bacterium]